MMLLWTRSHKGPSASSDLVLRCIVVMGRAPCSDLRLIAASLTRAYTSTRHWWLRLWSTEASAEVGGVLRVKGRKASPVSGNSNLLEVFMEMKLMFKFHFIKKKSQEGKIKMGGVLEAFYLFIRQARPWPFVVWGVSLQGYPGLSGPFQSP